MNTQELYLLHDETVNASKQAFILSFLVEVHEHNYDSKSSILGALQNHLDELKEQESKL